MEVNERDSPNIKIGVPSTSVISENVPEGFQLENQTGSTTVLVAPIAQPQSFYESLFFYSKLLKILTLLDSAACILFYFGGVSFLIFLTALPIAGYCGSKHFHRELIVGYVMYLIMIIITRSALIGVVNKLSYSIMQGLIIFMEIGVLVIATRFYKKLDTLNNIERSFLRNSSGQAYIVPSADVSRVD